MRIRFLAILPVLVLTVYADTTFVDMKIGISVTLSPAWEKVDLSDSSCMLVSLDKSFTSNIFIVKQTIPDTVTAREWTQAHFVAYKLFVEGSSEPLGNLLWFDSTTTAAQQGIFPSGNAWAPWLYSSFKSIDTAGIFVWAEYERYSACKTNGYEMYAIGDTTDMNRNFTTYAKLVQSVKIIDPANISVKPYHNQGVGARRIAGTPTQDIRWYNLRGQSIGVGASFIRPSGLVISPYKKMVTVKP
jgi:hypothetical protein